MKTFFVIILSLFFFSCEISQSNEIKEIDVETIDSFKPLKEDPFVNSMVKIQSFSLDAKKDNVIEGKNGTIVVLPKGCFVYKNGKIVKGEVSFKLSEALSLEEMILSNLTTVSNGKPLETDGMIHISATKNGDELFINKEIPIHIEIPTNQKKKGMKAYKGLRDENGNMNWVEPKELKNYLIPIDFALLDFLPEGFYQEVEKGMPFRNYIIANKALADSLYYSLALPRENETRIESFGEQEPEKHYTIEELDFKNNLTNSDSSSYLDNTSSCGINPAIIKTIKINKFQNTFISTREFEKRLKVLFKICRNDLLEIYIKNLDKNLWEIDSLVALNLVNSEYSVEFNNFQSQKLTNIEKLNRNIKILSNYYDKRLKAIEKDLNKTKEKALKEIKKQDKIAKKIYKKYTKFLLKREKYRMETYGFEWTEMGWINIDRGIIPKDWDYQEIQVTVENGKKYDRVYTYILYKKIKSLYSLKTNNNELFYSGDKTKKTMITPKNDIFIIVSIAYKDDNSFIAIKEYQTKSKEKISLTLNKSTLAEIAKTIKVYDHNGKENSIAVDLKYMTLIAKEEKRQKTLEQERYFIHNNLWYKANPCCSDLR